jgi:prostaglandin-endoperoxide synthase 2
MDVTSLISRMPDWASRGVLGLLRRSPALRGALTRRIVNRYAYAARTRPRPHSMAADYVTWPGLVDRTFSGRHLGAAPADHAPAEPDMDAVARLFERREFRPAADTSILFAFFAQWFTDGFLRTKWEPGPERFFRENESNHEIDLNQIYGAGEVQARMLRLGSEEPALRGRLRTQEIGGEIWPARLFEERDGEVVLADRYAPGPEGPGLYTPANFDRVTGHWTDDVKRHAFAVGLEHGNSTIGQAAMNALWVREHNRTAGILARAHPEWDDERVFQAARNVSIAVLLNIVIGDYIVHIAPLPVPLEARPGMAERERWYRTNHISVEFALLYRWHDLIPERLVVRDEELREADFVGANARLVRLGLDDVLLAASAQPAGRIGLHNTAPFLLARQEEGGRDVKRLSVEMGRRCRLPSFNAYRRHYGLRPYASFEELTGEREDAATLRGLYGEVDRLEWFVGLFAEGYGGGAMMGELLTTMVANDAFTQALTNPLLAESVHNAETFGEEGLEIVRGTRTLAEVIRRNTGLGEDARIGFAVPRAGAGMAA